MKNKLSDLNNHLFTQLERLNEEDLDDCSIEREIKRADGIVKIAAQIIENAHISLSAAKLIAEYGGDYQKALPESTSEKYSEPT